MSHDSVISALNALSKAEVITFAPDAHVRHLLDESDRAAIILIASTLEHTVTHMLEQALSSLNGDEMARAFGLNGPLGTFSSKIMFAQGLQIIDRQMAKRLNIIRNMRNTAAHYVGPLSFETPEIRAAVIQITSTANRPKLAKLNAKGIRIYFTHAQGHMGATITRLQSEYDDSVSIAVMDELMSRTDASPGKLAE